MFLNPGHKNLQVYTISRQLMKVCYRITLQLPPEEKFNLVQQIRRAALSVKLNINEGASGRSAAEPKRFWEISCGSVIEIDAAAEAMVDLDYLSKDALNELRSLLNSCFALLTKMVERT
ncbi:four helix bundle protein [Agriterribacter humi]|uniref:four helix bundle protein n=1 Tax=Agriterribacter humi TaxID=1104781 RepID=UPI0012642F5B|nr:four helix bundle protein [Agriterribacter humi]